MPEFTVLTEQQPITMLIKRCTTVINPRACQRLYENQFFENIVGNFNQFHIFTNYFVRIRCRINVSSTQKSSTWRYHLKFWYEHLFLSTCFISSTNLFQFDKLHFTK